MAISIDTIISRLDTLYGTAYKNFLDAQGAVDKYNTSAQLTSDAKAIARGGSDRIGVVAGENDLKVVGYPVATYSVYVNGGNVYFNNVLKSFPTTVVSLGLTDSSGLTFATDCTATTGAYAAYISCQDNALVPTVSVTKGNFCVYGTGATGVAPLPSAPRNEILLGKVIVQRSIPSGAAWITDIRPKYEIAPSDAMVSALFTNFDATENTVAAKTFKSDYVSAITALSNYCNTVTGKVLKEYTPTYSYTESFRQLYADCYGYDLYQNVYLACPSANPALSTYYAKNFYNTNAIDLVTNSSSWVGTSQINVYGVTATNSMLTAPVLTTDSTIYVSNGNAFATSGAAAIYNYNGSYDMITYTGRTATSITGVAAVDSVHKTGDYVYGVQSIPVYVASGIGNGVAHVVGTATTKFYSVISATYISVGTSNAQAIIRNH